MVCTADKRMKCGGKSYGSIYEIKSPAYFKSYGGCARKDSDDYKEIKKDAKCTDSLYVGEHKTIEECILLAKTNFECKQGNGFFAYGFN